MIRIWLEETGIRRPLLWPQHFFGQCMSNACIYNTKGRENKESVHLTKSLCKQEMSSNTSTASGRNEKETHQKRFSLCFQIPTKKLSSKNYGFLMPSTFTISWISSMLDSLVFRLKLKNKNIVSCSQCFNKPWGALGNQERTFVSKKELTNLLPVFCAIVFYSGSLHGDFVHDDIPAIVNNPDVNGDNSMLSAFSNDFWGQPMVSIVSHKSYRPITILLFR